MRITREARRYSQDYGRPVFHDKKIYDVASRPDSYRDYRDRTVWHKFGWILPDQEIKTDK